MTLVLATGLDPPDDAAGAEATAVVVADWLRLLCCRVVVVDPESDGAGAVVVTLWDTLAEATDDVVFELPPQAVSPIATMTVMSRTGIRMRPP